MYIVTQNRKSVVNLGNMWGIAVGKGEIFARPSYKEIIVLGIYDEERTGEIFKMILDAISLDRGSVIYMPEK